MPKNYLHLRKKYPKFVFEKYSWKISGKDLKVSFYFRVEPGIKFKPNVVIKNINKNQIQKIGVDSPGLLNNLVFHLGLIEILSYWKATCSPEIEIKAGSLNKTQIKWWRDLIIKGMGQFFYENKIDFQKPNFLEINTINESGSRNDYEAGSRKNRVLVPVGGGKDSIVTLEILKQAKKDITCFSLNPTLASRRTMKIAGYPTIIVKRKIDKKLLELNKEGYLNGHTPFSAYLAFLSVLCAVLFDFKFIAFSDERSSNEGNLKYLGKVINHQYSKSFDFEKRFKRYSKRYLAKDIEYFSFLRPLYEIQVAKLFSRYLKYFSAFISCNEAFRTYSGRKEPLKKWCNKCPKCLFVFATLYPFLGEYRLVKIFKENLFERIGFLPTMLRLIGEREFKPFECVGTKKESLVTFYLSWKKATQEKSGTPKARRIIKGEIKKIPFLLKHFQNKILPKYPDLEKTAKKIMNSWNDKHCLPKRFEKILKRTVLA